MEKQSTAHVPPVIRVFLSSTFADMENERTYFNEVLVPRLNRICAERGVSFFSVDLRWGITEDDQVGGQVIPICLGEIDKCRPYFIGILGNRYGSLMEEVPLQIGDSIPWLKGKEGHSITELEMLYAVLDHEREDNVRYASFYFRSDALTESWYGHTEEEPGLKALKERIRQDPGVRHSTYDSVEEFGERVMADILAWCDREFPVPQRVREVRRAWYDGELLRNYVRMQEHHDFLDAYCQESRRSLLIYGSGERGKTTLLSAWEPDEGKKILINCGSDDAFRYWPSVVCTIIKELNGITQTPVYPDKPLRSAMVRGMMHSLRGQSSSGSSSDPEVYYLNARDQEAFRVAFLNWVSALTLDEPVCVVINDLNLLEDHESAMLSWIPVETEGSVRFICSTNREDTTEIADIIGWNCKEMPLFTKKHAHAYIRDYLSVYGKGLAASQYEDVQASPVTVCPGDLRTTADFLISHGRFHNLDTLLHEIRDLSDRKELYPFLYDYVTAEAGERAAAITSYVLNLLALSPLSLTEGECHRLAYAALNVTPLEWSATRNILEQFRVIKGDYWNITSQDLKTLIQSRMTPEVRERVSEELGDYFAARLAEAMDGGGISTTYEDTARITAYAKAVLVSYANANHTKLLEALGDPAILGLLCNMERAAIRGAWMHLVLHSDLDLNEAFYATFRRVYKACGAAARETVCVADLLVDFELLQYVDDVKEAMGSVKFFGSLHEDASAMSGSFTELMGELHRVRREESRRDFYRFIQAQMEKEDYAPIELCQLLFHKADTEARLHLHQDLIVTANRYFRVAVQSGNLFEFQRALNSLALAHHRLSNDEEALRLYRKLLDLYLTQGDYRSYMAVRNSMGVTLNSLDMYDEAIPLLEETRRIWLRMKAPDEANLVAINLFNAYANRGETDVALEMCKELYGEIKDDPEQERVLASLMGNMGNYAYDLKRYAEAEGYLLDTLRIAERLELESTFLLAASTLSKIYEGSGSFMKSFAILERKMEMLWQRKEYGRVIDTMEDACEQLLLCNHGRQVKGFTEKWRQRFAETEEGARYFSEKVKTVTVDSREQDRLKEALAMAKSEGDPREIGDACRKMALALKDTNRAAYWKAMIQAADTYRDHGLAEELDHQSLLMIINAFEEGELISREELDCALTYTRTSAIHTLAGCWLKLAEYRQEDGDTEGEGNNTPSEEEVEALLAQTAKLYEAYPDAVFQCFYDTATVIVDYASAETVIGLVRLMTGGEAILLEIRFEKNYLRSMQEDLEELKKDYMGFRARERLNFYERAVVFLHAMDANNAATLSGNIALIFRRRKDEENTLRYHRLSMEAYLKQNRPYDCLIEKLNLATAYKEFDRVQDAIQILREGMAEARDQDIPALEASMAGNLAALLRDHGTETDHDEVLRCFAIEENFFREDGLIRDLVISLINQVAYHMLRKDRVAYLPKLEEAGYLIRKYRFQDFYRALAYMENQAAQDAPAKEDTNGETPEEFFTDLLSDMEDYRMGRVMENEGTFYVDCFPKSQDEHYRHQFRLMWEPACPGEVYFIGAYLPAQYSEDAKDNVKAYIDWSNGLTFYTMQLMDRFQVQGGCRVMGSSREELRERVGFFFSLWHCDCLNLTLLSLGFPDVSACQGMKLQAIHHEDDEE